jgi:nocardicin N-oxygenase
VPPAYAGLRARCPVSRVTLPSGDEGYLVTRHEDVRTVLGDPRFSRAATVRPGAPRLTAVPFEQNGLFTMDPPEHTRLRALAAAAFTPRRVRDLTPRIAEITGELLDTLAKGPNPADLANTFAVELPTAVICELLGVPFEDRDRFRIWSDAILSLTSFTPEQMAGHRAALAGYLAALIRAKREEPGDDLLSALVRARDEHGALSEQELVLLAATLLVAGHETTVGLIGTAVFTLLRAPGGLTALPTDPDGLDAAVEELLRVNPIGDGGPLRVTLEEVEVAGTVIPANSAVIAAICSASHDETAYPGPDPAAYAPGRPGPAHLAFGHGPHYCLGAPLARAELRVALSELARRFPGMRLAVPPGEVRMRTGLIVNRLEELPVTW